MALLVTGAAAAGAATNPELRRDVRRLEALFRPLEPSSARVPVPPPLPPSKTVPLIGRGEAFVRETGPAGAPPVLLFHGWGVTADVNFFALYERLSDAYHVIALDHRGHGRGIRSPEPFTLEACADDASALLTELATGPAIVVGYSMGGPIAMLLARRHPHLVTGLVLEATALEWQSSWYERLIWRSVPLIELLVRLARGDSFVERLTREAIDEDHELAPYGPWLATELRRGDLQDLMAAGRALSCYDARRWASSLTVPTASLITTRDRLVPPAKQRRMAAAMGAKMFTLAGDHDSPLANGLEYSILTRACVDWVAQAAERSLRLAS
jgi:pimeloyl-ACP methyl ester carboxylesterase